MLVRGERRGRPGRELSGTSRRHGESGGDILSGAVWIEGLDPRRC
jgi:hypothetical protein